MESKDLISEPAAEQTQVYSNPTPGEGVCGHPWRLLEAADMRSPAALPALLLLILHLTATASAAP